MRQLNSGGTRNMRTAFVIGTAGSGKTVLTGSLASYLRAQGSQVQIANLDPAVRFLPYPADFDIRERVDIDEITEKYQLGPNGSLIVATDLVASWIDKMIEEMEDEAGDIDVFLIDTPGQLEVFAYRRSGQQIVKHFPPDESACLFLFDSSLVRRPSEWVALLLLASSVQLRLKLPMVHALSKSDLVPEEDLERIVGWSEMPETLLDDLEIEKDLAREYTIDLAQAMHGQEILLPVHPISSLTGDGFELLAAQLSHIWTRGEDWAI